MTDLWPVVDGSAILARRDYPAAPADVWEALTDPERLSRWFGETKGELRAHGEWTVTFDNGSARGTVSECVPPERFTTSWRWDHEPADQPAAEVEVTLTSNGDTTSLALRHTGVDPGSATGQAAGWYAHLEGLARQLEGAEDGDWYADFTRCLQAIKT